MNRMDYQTFIEMLRKLNQFIVDEYDPEYVLDIRAIGGFSMIIHKRLGRINSPREKSRDIDSLTPDYPDEIIAANINIYYANLESMLMFKIRAMEIVRFLQHINSSLIRKVSLLIRLQLS